MKIRKMTFAFTLIELLIVVAIIGILAAIAVPNFLNAQIRAKIARCKADMRSFATAFESYYVDWNTFPDPAWDYDIMAFRGFHKLTTPVAYMSSIPDNPFGESMENSGEMMKGYEYGAGKAGVGARIHPMNTYIFESHGPGKVELTHGSIATMSYPGGGWQTYDAARLLGLIYHPSNGVNSRGEIISVGGIAPPEPGVNRFFQVVKGGL